MPIIGDPPSDSPSSPRPLLEQGEGEQTQRASIESVDTREDVERMARVARGDEGALRELYDRHGATAMGMAMRVLRSREQAEEILQEVFLDVWRRSGSYDARRASPRSWIMCMVRTRSIDRLRSNGAAEKSIRRLTAEPDAAPADPPLVAIEQRTDRELVRGALASLPSEQRQAIEMAYFDGLTLREVAERTAQPLGTVKSRVRLALMRLAGLLGERR